jgi:hypothetical protein
LSLVDTGEFDEDSFEFPYEPPVSPGEKAFVQCADALVFLAVEGWSSSCAESLSDPTPEQALISGKRILDRWLKNLGEGWVELVGDAFDINSSVTYLMAVKE